MESIQRRRKEPVRCGGCGRLLFMARPGAIIEGVEAKCPRCGTLNIITLRPTEPSPDRPRAAEREEGS
jgi:phage FluMu protein Com